MAVRGFLDVPEALWVAQNELAFAFADRFPVSPGHTLVVTRRLVSDWWAATPTEKLAVLELIEKVKAKLDESHHPDGYNIGFNAGQAAGQTVFHLHVHVIPRYQGDMEDPRGGVRHVIPHLGNYLRRTAPQAPGPDEAAARPASPSSSSSPSPHPRLVTPSEGQMRVELVRSLTRTDFDRIDLLVSFLMRSGVDLLAAHVDEALARGVRIRVLTTDYLHITDPAALGFFLDRVGTTPEGGALDVKVFSDAATNFHPKAYLFSSSRSAEGVALVGSSNLSRSGLELGIEWNLMVQRIDALHDEFESLWSDPRATTVTTDWLRTYDQRRLLSPRLWTEAASPVPPPEPDERSGQGESDSADGPDGPDGLDGLDGLGGRGDSPGLVATSPDATGVLPTSGSGSSPRPTAVQAEALAALTATRIEGNTAGLVVLATGLGKTWLAAFDSTRPEFRRTLFVAHRKEILLQARDVYRRIMPTRSLTLFAGEEQDMSGDVVFASIQSLHRHLEGIDAGAFDYVVVDEFHHAEAPTYRRTIGHLRPRFLLGLTATPDRTDSADLMALCSDNLVYECGLTEGIRRNLLSPFIYRAIRDVADYEQIPWRSQRFDPAELTVQLETEQRARQVYDEWVKLGGNSRRAIGFCCSITHAQYMADFYSAHGVDALAVHSGPDSAPRAETLERFRAGQIRVLFTVDLFNEGVDIPDLDVVMLLRPTESPVVFLQQIGRGLRRSPGKERLDVVDLVGNHRSFLVKAHLLAALVGARPATNREAVEVLGSDMTTLPEGCSIIVDTEVVEMLRALTAPDRRQDRLRATLDAWRSLHGDRRPTALELSLATGTAHELKSMGGWFGGLGALGELSGEEAAVLAAVPDLLAYVEHGSYTKCFKLITLRVLTDNDSLRDGMDLADLALASRWAIDRDARLRQDLTDAAFATPLRPTAAEWQAYWRKNPIAALTRTPQGREEPFFSLHEDRLTLVSQVPDHLWPTLTAMITELVDYRLHRYLESRSTRRPGEQRKPLDPSGTPLDATFTLEDVDGIPTAVYFGSAGGSASSRSARNTDYVAGVDVVLARMRDLDIVIEDAYVDSTTVSALTLTDRRLSPHDGASYPIQLRDVEDLAALRRALLRSMARVGQPPGTTSSGNSRKAMRLVISGASSHSPRELADTLAGLPPQPGLDVMTS